MNHFAENLKLVRKNFGWSQEEAAKRLNTRVRNLRNYESGGREPNIKMLIKITEVFAIDDLYLFISAPLLQNVA